MYNCKIVETRPSLRVFIARVKVVLFCKLHVPIESIPLFKSTSGQRTFYYCIVSLWNSLDNSFNLNSATLFLFLSIDFEPTYSPLSFLVCLSFYIKILSCIFSYHSLA